MAKVKALDFTNVKEGGGRFKKTHYPPGDYKGKVMKVEDAKKKSDGSPMWLFTIQVKSGLYPYYCQFDSQTLWKIRNLFIAAGLSVPKKRVKADPNKVVGREIGVTLGEDEYEGKLQGEIDSVFPVSELEGEGDDDDADDDEDDDSDDKSSDDEEEEDDDEDEEPEPPKAKKKKKKKKKPAEDDEELEELDIEDV